MSFSAIAEALYKGPADAGLRLTLVMLADNASEDRTVRISVRRMCELLGCTRVTVQRRMRLLEAGGYIARVATRDRKGGQGPNLYTIARWGAAGQ